MELGDPPLYAEVNRVIREMDLTHLQYLGPFVQALGDISCWGEKNKLAEDKIKTGIMNGGAD